MPRSLWTGAISFGLVNIPVKLYRATTNSSAKTVSFHQLHKQCGARLQHKRWCPRDDVEVPWKDVVKGYEIGKGRYVEITDEELDELLPEDDYAAIAIESFVALAELDPIYYDRAYYVSPDGSPKAYSLLHAALSDAGRVAIARVRLRTRSHLAVVRPQEGHLLLSTMFYADEIVDASTIAGLPSGKHTVDKRQLEAAEQLIASMTVPFRPERYQDDYTEKIERIIEQKVTGGAVTESVELPGAAHGKVINLLDALRRSVKATAPTGPAAPKRAKAGHRTSRARRAHRGRNKAG